MADGEERLQRSVIYNGACVVSFDPKFHKYFINGKKAVSVTTVLKVINKPSLIDWAVRLGVQELRKDLNQGIRISRKVIESVSRAATTALEKMKDHNDQEWSRRVLEMVINDELSKVLIPDFGEVEALCDKVSKAHEFDRQRAANHGQKVHSWISQHLKGQKPATPDEPAVKQGVEIFLCWVADSRVVFRESERPVYSRANHYAGTMDFEADVDGKLMIGDIKTGNRVYPEMFLQTAAYQGARQEECPHLNFGGNVIVNCSREGHVEFKTTDRFDDNNRAFLAALALYRHLNPET